MAVSKLYNPNTSQWEPSSGAVPGLVQSVNGFTGAVLLDAAKVGAVDVAKVGNLLTANQASVETDTTGFGSNATLSRSTTRAVHGIASARVVTTAASGTHNLTTPSTVTAVVPGQVYTLQAKVWAGTSGRTGQMYAFWYDSGGGAVSNSSGSVIQLSTSAWALVDHTAVAPATAAYGRIVLNVSTGAIGEEWWADCLGIWAGAGGEWAMPGTPIANLGHLVTHPNTDDVLVRKWDSGLGRWQTVHYDSGWRTIPYTSGTANWTSGNILLRRVGSTVHMDFVIVKMNALASKIYDLPAGFTGPASATSHAFTSRETVTTGNPYWFCVEAGSVANRGFALIGSFVNTYGFNARTSWSTTDALPTSLPGTLVSAAPA